AVGVQQEFPDRRPPKDYRYDSSLAPELCWDENAARDQAEWLLTLIERAATQGEAAVFVPPQVWAGTGEVFDSLPACVARLKSLTRPFLNWAGKAERHRFRLHTLPLFVHERLSTQAILSTLETYKAVGTTRDMFGDPGLDISDQLDAYDHLGPWSNRLILGDSLQVMNSLLEYEGLGGQVQMIYMDPPYGVKYGSNFQPFVRKREVKHGQDDDMIREPEMVKAYRDTWELGLHSYLTYLRDRLLLARELLKESGSIFVQISDENLHHVREVMDDVYGANNFSGLISFFKTSSQSTSTIQSVVDYLLVYAKNKNTQKYNPLLNMKTFGDRGAKQYVMCISPTMDDLRRMTPEELANPSTLPLGWKVCRLGPTTSQGFQEGRSGAFYFEGTNFYPSANRHWSYDPSPGGEMQLLAMKGRIRRSGQGLATVLLADDNPTTDLDNIWLDTGTGSFTEQQSYVVQTGQKVIQRCMLMTTDPGDLVLDPTCGGGTTAYVAEQWGRRWITCDTSRVPLALTRQRLLTATFPWYQLKEPGRGPAGGFVYERRRNRKGEEVGGLVPRITLKSIANDEEPETVTLVDRPEVNAKITRVCGRFTVEATVQAARTVDDPPPAEGETLARARTAEDTGAYENPRRYLDRMIEVLRQSHTLRLPGNTSLHLAQVRPLSGADHDYLHAEAEETAGGAEGKAQRIAVVFGPEHGAIDSHLVFEAAREAYFLKYDALYLFGFAIQAKARELVADRRKLRLPCVYVSVTPDVVMSDLLKTSQSSQVFAVTGLPDVRLQRLERRGTDGAPLYQVSLLGLDIFRPQDLETEAIPAQQLPCWMLDSDYNGLVFMAHQVFFPRTSAWENLEKSLRGRFAEGVWAHLAGTVSEPFAAGPQRQIAVKVIDERGHELMVVKSLAL
ncbi:MAG: site-specific DNA-methyltransferase, partial [Gammaproteobacteria bacterium]|nr:site-specific DNA-methyltransferase [Gammaproteobacteria bacterium]